MSDGWILIVDDDADIREMVAMLVESYGFETREAANGAQALERLRSHGRPAMILLDLRMPGMSGPELMTRLHAEPALEHGPVVVLSGDRAARETADELGADGFLAKPVTVETLLRAVDTFAHRPPPPAGTSGAFHPAP